MSGEMEFPDVAEQGADPQGPRSARDLEAVYDIPVTVSAVLGKTTMQVSQLLICGLEIPVCVYQTAMDALREGMGVTILSDAVTGRRSEDGRACLEALRAAGAHVLPTETVFYAMVGDATHPQFRAFTDLVKQAA